MTVTRAALYDRVSTRQQAEEGTSLEDQRARLRRRATQEEWEVVIERADAGVDGDLPFAERPGASEVVAACERGEVDVVLATDVDRFGRDTVETLSAARDLRRAGVGLILIDNGIDTRHGGELELDIRAAVAAEEKRKILERTRRGLRARAAAGEWPGGPPPFGHRLEAPAERAPRRLVLDDEECAVLRKAADLILDDGHSTWTAAELLNALGLVPRNAARWVHNRLRVVLMSETLAGRWVYDKEGDPIEVAIPAVLPPERRAALMAALRATTTARSGNKVYPLSHGRLVGLCGAPMHGVHRKDRASRAYRCLNRRPEAEHRCDDHAVHAQMVEDLVWGEVVALLAEPDRLLAMAGQHLDAQGDRLEVERDQLASVERKLASLDRARTERVTAALKAGLDPELLKAAVGEIDAEVAALRTHRDRTAALYEATQTASDRAYQLRALAATARDRLGSMGPLERQAVLDLLNVRVAVTGWRVCPACGGKGKVRGGRGGSACTTCEAMRRVPSFRVEGEVLDLGPLAEAATEDPPPSSGGPGGIAPGDLRPSDGPGSPGPRCAAPRRRTRASPGARPNVRQLRSAAPRRRAPPPPRFGPVASAARCAPADGS